MIRIDEIYNSIFWPWVQKDCPPHTSIYHCDPPGRIDPESIHHYGINPSLQHVIIFDQEPLIPDLNRPLFDEIQLRTQDSKKGAIVVSECDSDNLDYTCQRWNLRPFYYFFHGWAALDWYRGYNRSFLIRHWQQRKINKTFISPNRIIGGFRQHRVLMLYWFAKMNLIDSNWVSASLVCPVEAQHILDIAKTYVEQIPDIQTVLGHLDLPLLFPNEDQPRMSSCWLDQFDISAESMIYHVSETIYTGRRLQLTEKSFKPIALGMPFVMSSTPGSLAYLRSYGFQTFGSVWDESYDSELDDILRAQKIAKVLKTINDLDHNSKQDLWQQCWPIIEHNWNHFYHGNFEALLWQELVTMLSELREYLN